MIKSLTTNSQKWLDRMISSSYFNWISLQCQPAVVDEIFPGWQWRVVNPITRKEEEEFQPFNTTLPSCSKLYKCC